MRLRAGISAFLLSVLLLLIFPAISAEPALSWDIQTVKGQNASAFGNCPIIVDSNGTAHIAYMAFSGQINSLIYASSNNPVWDSQTVESGNISRVFSLVTDKNGNANILYGAGSDSGPPYTLKLASYDRGNWNMQNTSLLADEADLQFDHMGSIHIAYVTGGSILCYASRTENAWNIETADNSTTDIFKGASLAFDSTNSPFIVYNSSSAIIGSRYTRLAYIIDSQWKFQVLSLSTPAYSIGNLAVDAKDFRHLVFAESNRVSYASFYRSYYDSQIVSNDITTDSIGGLCFDLQDNPHFCYTKQNHELVYAAYSNGSWNVETVDSGSAFGRSYLALDVDGNPHIAFRTNSSTPNATNLMYTTATTQVPEGASLLITTLIGAIVATASVAVYILKTPTYRRSRP